VDYIGVLRAAIANYRRGKISQCSAVTQQLARNSFELRERNHKQKLVEMFLARRIGRIFEGKIMELYLNRVYFVDSMEWKRLRAGILAARGDLNASQCAMLAGL
jgi:membrane carboxypeptidase/penicillin-binding protein